MLKLHYITCPKCDETTSVSVATPDSSEQRLATTSCRKCRTRLLIVTLPDGTLQVADQEGKLLAVVPSPFDLTELMRIRPSIWQPRWSLVEAFDHRPEWAQELQRVLAEKQNNPRPLSIPRRIFISYRWGTPDRDDWVAALAEQLTEQENEVVFDRYEISKSDMPAVPELVSRIADCHYVLVVLDTEYVERISARSRSQAAEGWIWDELQTALAFASKGLTKIIGLLREDTDLPSWFVPFQLHRTGNTFDVRESGAIEQVVSWYFRKIGQPPAPNAAIQAAALLHSSAIAERRGEFEKSADLAAKAAEIAPHVPDGHSRLARAAFRSLRIADAYDAAQRALAIEPENHDALLYGASAAADLERWDDCIRMARNAAERDVTDVNAHRNLGRGLTARKQLEAALAHFNIGRAVAPDAPQLHFEAATVYRKLGRAAAAVECLETASRLSPDHAPTLINLTAAAIEAGRATVAYEALHALTTLQADAAEIGPLTRALVQFCQDPSSQPNLSGGIQTTGKVGPIRCDSCEAEIHANHERDNLCGGCGAVLAEVPRGSTYKPCPHCGADGLVSCFSTGPTLKGAFRCPYCRSGTIGSDAPASLP